MLLARREPCGCWVEVDGSVEYSEPGDPALFEEACVIEPCAEHAEEKAMEDAAERALGR